MGNELNAVPVEPVSRLDPSGFDPSRWRSLTTAPKDRRILVLCDDSAPFPVMIARWSGEKWTSKDDATDGKKWTVRAWQPLPEPGPFELQCSFCAKFVSEVGKLIAGPLVFICNECVALCDEIVAETQEAIAMEAATAGETRSGLDPKGDSAGRQASPKEDNRD